MRDAEQQYVVVPLPPGPLDRLARETGFRRTWPLAERRDAFLAEVAQTLGSSPPARDLDISIVVRGGSHPAIGFLGVLTDAQQARLHVLAGSLSARVGGLRYVGYGAAEQACLQLAQQLEERLSPRLLDEARFVAIPRGGHVVLGLLATALGLRGEQLELGGQPAVDGLCVVVDDCVLTGHRFATWLRTHPEPRVVLAAICAPEPMADAILAAESDRVLAVEVAEVLPERGTPLGAEHHEQWWQVWSDRLADERYWMGDVQPVAFAWKEPDAPLWNPVTERREPGWAVLPGEICLGNRPDPRHPRVGPPVQLQAEGPGPLRAGSSVLHGQHAGRTTLLDTDAGDVVVLEGVAAAMWEAVVGEGSHAAAIAELLTRYEVGRERLEADLDAFVDTLLARRLLVDARDGRR